MARSSKLTPTGPLRHVLRVTSSGLRVHLLTPVSHERNPDNLKTSRCQATCLVLLFVYSHVTRLMSGNLNPVSCREIYKVSVFRHPRWTHLLSKILEQFRSQVICGVAVCIFSFSTRLQSGPRKVFWYPATIEVSQCIYLHSTRLRVRKSNTSIFEEPCDVSFSQWCSMYPAR